MKEETITTTKSELVRIYTIWCKESQENPKTFESIDVSKMTEDQIKEYAEDCANYLIGKLNTV